MAYVAALLVAALPSALAACTSGSFSGSGTSMEMAEGETKFIEPMVSSSGSGFNYIGPAELTSIQFTFSSEDGSTFDITSTEGDATWTNVDSCIWTGTQATNYWVQLFSSPQSFALMVKCKSAVGSLCEAKYEIFHRDDSTTKATTSSTTTTPPACDASTTPRCQRCSSCMEFKVCVKESMLDGHDCSGSQIPASTCGGYQDPPEYSGWTWMCAAPDCSLPKCECSTCEGVKACMNGCNSCVEAEYGDWWAPSAACTTTTSLPESLGPAALIANTAGSWSMTASLILLVLWTLR